MKKNKLTAFLAAIFLIGTLCLASCEQEQDDTKVNDPHRSSISHQVSVRHWGEKDLLITYTSIYDPMGHLIKETRTTDTISGLGETMDTYDTGKTDDNDEEVDTTVRHAKNYAVYLTVKP